mgnify:CR=1 FL=1
MVVSRCFGIRILVDCVTLFKDIIPGLSFIKGRKSKRRRKHRRRRNLREFCVLLNVVSYVLA